MNVALTHISQELAEQLVQTAHAICPYSNAIRGNIDVNFTVTSR
jgi:organic hydroperoxide reductase OsmC/OhrA